jgi:1-acyl-sn-glycerol-3-phosphate acyltransferase
MLSIGKIQSLIYKNYDSQRNFLNIFYMLFNYFYDPKVDFSCPDKVKNDGNILLISNHPKMHDMMYLCKFIQKFPEHNLIIFVKKSLENIPLIGNTIKNIHITLERNIQKDKETIINKLEQISNDGKKYILLIFPEGTTYCKETIQSFREDYKSVLRPKLGGLSLIKQYYKYDYIYDASIFYHDSEISNYDEDFIKNDIAKNVDIHIKKLENFPEDFVSFWREKDEYLSKKNKKEVVYTPNLLLNSSMFLLLSVFPSICMYGIFNSFILVILLFTSYEYHYYKRNKLFDVIMSCIVWMRYYRLYKIYTSIKLLEIGLLFYIFEKLYGKFNIKSSTVYFLHTCLHIFCYTSIWVEFLFK